MEQLIFKYAGRGVTKWIGSGVYSGEQSDLLLTVVSKKEAFALRHILQKRDPGVFVIVHENAEVWGNFKKRFWT